MYQYPHTIENKYGEKLVFKGLVKEADGDALDNGTKKRPEPVTGAFLITRYSTEFEVQGIPVFVKKMIIPIQYSIAKMRGAYKGYKEAPAPFK